jgi:hypothetical protein
VSNPIETNPTVPADAANATPPTYERIAAEAAWLRQARLVRDEAFGLLRDRIREDLEFAAQVLGGRNSAAFASEVEYASKLTAEYLAESERLFALMSTLVQNGQSRRTESGEPTNWRGH